MNDKVIVTQLPMTVLCVDDELDIIRAMKRLSRKRNCNLLFASDSAQALELMQLNDVRLIISDMRISAMSDAELLERADTSYPNCYRILLTGYVDVMSTVSAVNKGELHRYLQKLWDNRELDQNIENKVTLRTKQIHT